MPRYHHTLFALALVASVAQGQAVPCRPLVAPLYPNCPPPIWYGTTPGTTTPTPTDPSGTNPMANPNPNALDNSLREGAFARGGEGGGQASATANPSFDGDFAGITYNRTIITDTVARQEQIGVQQVVSLDANGRKVVTDVPIYRTVLVPVTRVLRLPVLSRYNGIKITDNDGPRPQDRIYSGYNFYSNVNPSLNPGLGAVDLHRETIGFEKTFLDGDASFGMRLPFVQVSGPPGTNSSGAADLSLLFKYAIYNDRRTGDLFSTGLVLTVPTGADPGILGDGTTTPRSVIFQPWAGFIKNFDRAYVQGITSILAPTDSRDPTLLGNSLGVGYWIYRSRGDGVLTGIVPVAEIHVTTPLNKRDPSGDVFLQDQVNLTTGVHFATQRAFISPAIGVPLVSPSPFRVEFLLNFNLRF